MKDKPLFLLLAFTIFSELLALILILAAPSDLENQWLWGYSLNRWLLIFFTLICGLVSAYCLFSTWRGTRFYQRLAKFFNFSAAPVSVILFVSLFLLAGLFLISFTTLIANRFVMARLQPVFLMALLFGVGLVLYDTLHLRHAPWLKIAHFGGTIRAKAIFGSESLLALISQTFSGYWFLGLILVLSFPLLFFTAIQFAFPTGSAGLYTLMADGIAAAGINLPQSVLYYGPGGMPFAYPPAGLYLMAFFTSVFHIPDFTYLRFAPPLFLWLSLLPLGLLTLELTQSRVAAICAALVVASSQRIFLIQGTSGGIVRGLAFLLALWGIYFFLKSIKLDRKRDAAFAGIFIGLTGLTHLGYAEFAVFFVIAYGATHLFSKRTWKTALIAGAAAMLVAVPWVLVMTQRYGWNVFVGAFQSHENDYFLAFLTQPEKIIPWFENSLRPVFRLQFMWGMLVLAMLISLFKNKTLLVWFGLLLIFTSEGDRYLITCGAVLIGLLAGELAAWLQRSPTGPKLTWRPILFVAAICGIFYFNGWQTIPNSNNPLIDESSLQLAEFIQTTTPSQEVYLLVAGMEEAEWYPYLLQRAPIAGSWGSEWLGVYPQQLGYLSDINACNNADSALCLDEVMAKLAHRPGILITRIGNAKINQDLGLRAGWKVVYTNEEFVVWTQIR